MMAHCCAPTTRPRLLGGANSEIYTGTDTWVQPQNIQKGSGSALTLSRADTDTEAIDEPASHKHSDILRSTTDDRANTPDDGADLDGSLSTKDIRQLETGQGTRLRACIENIRSQILEHR